MSKIFACIAISLAAPSLCHAQATNDSKEEDISAYLADVSPAAVSAASLLGVAGTAVTNVQTAQDFVLSVNPFSSNDSKGGYGISITPARTTILPMSGQQYLGSPFFRLLGSTSFAYAENKHEANGHDYARRAFSIDASFYLNLQDDPVQLGYIAFTSCADRKTAQQALVDAVIAKDEDRIDKAKKAVDAADKLCQAAALENPKWNASRVAISYGSGRIKLLSGAQVGLGRTVVAAGIFNAGKDKALHLTFRRTDAELDLTSLEAVPAFKSSNLAAARFTVGSSGERAIRWLVEVSNAKASNSSASSVLFKQAVGIDKKLMDGVWLEFRYGRAKTLDGKSSETKGLMNLTWSPTSTLFGKKKS